VNSLEQAFLDCASLSWRLSWLILLLLVLRRPLLRLASPRWCFALWLVIAGALVIPARAPLSISDLRLDRWFSWPAWATEPTALPPAETRPITPAPPLSGIQLSPTIESRMEDTGTQEPPTTDDASTSRDAWVSGLALLWLGGVVGLLGLRGIAAIRLQHRLTHARSTSVDTSLVAAVKAGCVELGLRSPPEILTTPLVTSPALCGILRPRLLFPVGFAAQVSPDELRWVIRHELGHLRRRDLLSHSLLQLACAVHWFNPLVWLAARLARQDGEMACDDFVLHHARPKDSAAYGRALLSVIGAVREQSRLPATLGIVENKRQLLTRITMISSHRPQTLRRTLTGAALLSLFALIGYTEEPKAAPTVPAPAGKAPAVTRMTDAEMYAYHQSQIAERDRWAAEAKVVLRAIGTPGGVPVALFDVNDEPWLVKQGSRLLTSSVTTIDVQNARVITTSPRNQSQRTYDLTEPRAVKFPEFTPQQIESLLSPERSKRERPFIPFEVQSAWDSINREGKEAILLNYLRSGLVLAVRTGPHLSGGSSSLLFSKQIDQLNRERYKSFLASLTVEQRAAFEQGPQMAVRLDAPADQRANQAAQAKARIEKRDAVVSMLNPEQRKLYETWIASMDR
jgi:beta-lactamase regulating signal transducer with metallopeptidase domain